MRTCVLQAARLLVAPHVILLLIVPHLLVHDVGLIARVAKLFLQICVTLVLQTGTARLSARCRSKASTENQIAGRPDEEADSPALCAYACAMRGEFVPRERHKHSASVV